MQLPPHSMLRWAPTGRYSLTHRTSRPRSLSLAPTTLPRNLIIYNAFFLYNIPFFVGGAKREKEQKILVAYPPSFVLVEGGGGSPSYRVIEFPLGKIPIVVLSKKTLLQCIVSEQWAILTTGSGLFLQDPRPREIVWERVELSGVVEMLGREDGAFWNIPIVPTVVWC